LPSVAELAKAVRTDWTQAQLEEYYSDDNYRRQLY
jgi:hypothetical protein